MTSAAESPSRRQWLVLAAAFLGWMFDGMEMGIFPLVARPALQDMQAVLGPGDEGFVQRWMGIVTALFLLGAALGGLVFGWLGDRIGRVKAMTWSILCYSLFTGLCYFAAAPWQLGALRFVAALGMGGEWALGVALVMETWPAARRPLTAGLIGAAANLGYTIIAVIGIAFPITRDSWRWVMLVGAAPALLTFLIRLFVPESERWQAAVQGARTSPLAEVLSPRLRRTTLLAIAFASIVLIVTWGIVQWIPLWADRMTDGQHPVVKAWCQLWQSLGASLGCVLAALAGGWFGRRPVYFTLCLSALAVCQWLFRGFHEVNAGFYAVVFLVGLTTASFYGWLPLYLPELFPTRARATGQGLAFNFGRILAALGAWQMPALMGLFDKDYARAGAAIVLVYLVGMVLIWFAPETKDRPLPD
ncbi:MAG: putative niacin/nicotinamide transporter NaiP [Verrucomicrobiota bacterium]|jgi:MFS family permease